MIRVKILPVKKEKVNIKKQPVIKVCQGNTNIIEKQGDFPEYTGEYLITPSTKKEIIMKTEKKSMSKNVTIRKIPFFETSNETGKTVYIGD